MRSMHMVHSMHIVHNVYAWPVQRCFVHNRAVDYKRCGETTANITKYVHTAQYYRVVSLKSQEWCEVELWIVFR